MIPKFPKKKPVKPYQDRSSNVVSFDHNPEARTLTVNFHGGRIYRYDNVTAETHQKMKAAESKGAFVNEHLTPHHTFKRMK